MKLTRRVAKPKKSYAAKFNSAKLKSLGKSTLKQGKLDRTVNPKRYK